MENKIKNFLSKKIDVVLVGFLLILLFLAAGEILIIWIFQIYGENVAQKSFDLIKVFLSWPILGSFIFLVFIYKFSCSMEKFLENHKLDKIGPIGTQEQQSGEEEKKISDFKEAEINGTGSDNKEFQKLIEEKTRSTEFYEFSYLSLFFVDITKRVLKWFYDKLYY